MVAHLCITVRWIGDRFHGLLEDKSGPEWPPSPFRLFQALVAGAHRHGFSDSLGCALEWLERQPLGPDVLAVPEPPTGITFDHYVPDNDSYLDHNRRGIRRFQPILLAENAVVHYVWKIDKYDSPPLTELDNLASTLGALGWAVDCAYATATLASVQKVDAQQFRHDLKRYVPIRKTALTTGSLRVPKPGSIANLLEVRNSNRKAFAVQSERRRKKWPNVFNRVLYTGLDQQVDRPHAVFELRQEDDSFYPYSQRKLMHIAGMIRHLAKEAMQQSPPSDVDEQWVERYVMGHRDKNAKEHRQFSYLPLPSIGHEYTDHAVRRVMIAAPVGDDAWLEHLTARLAGRQLKPEAGSEFGKHGPPALIRVYRDKVARRYTAQANRWASVTPIILPGHDDHRPAKTRKLIAAALAQAGIDQPCTYEWSKLSRFRKSLSAHKYDRAGRPVFLKPGYLQNLTAVHLTLTFDDDLKVPGPLVIGAGRHCGFGLMARHETNE